MYRMSELAAATRYYSDFQVNFVNHVVPLISSDDYHLFLEKYEEVVGAEIHAARKDSVYWRALTGSFVKSIRRKKNANIKTMPRLNLAFRWYSNGKLSPEYHVAFIKDLLEESIRKKASSGLQIAFLSRIGSPAFKIIFSDTLVYTPHSNVRIQVIRTIFVGLLRWALDPKARASLVIHTLNGTLDSWVENPGLGELQSDPTIRTLMEAYLDRDIPK